VVFTPYQVNVKVHTLVLKWYGSKHSDSLVNTSLSSNQLQAGTWLAGKAVGEMVEIKLLYKPTLAPPFKFLH
jgi:hypothetical protein